MRTLNDDDIEGFLDRPRLLLLVFSSGEDLSSQVFGQELTALERELGSRIEIGVLDIRRAPRSASDWGVRESDVPVQVIFYKGAMQQVLRGVRSAAALRDVLKDNLYR